MEKKITTNWTGSETTETLVRKQIKERWGSDEANRYDPKINCMTIRQWNKIGYRVKSGEKAIKSFVVIEKKDKNGEVVKKFPKTINLFFDVQVIATE
ncbi:hypothetical protein A2227_07225 [Candidatus Falkowbacteria bacterium RIFOXYA2_FULL_47_19]|uniref:N-terminal domain-containing protein n=1 Tax=Candidatus Falkowbacteria bacterium RIFOXYA2_FULL_47_19 TaxID=1797994 RepID=A0A1F5SFA4_9BACT|nr:MAG: hypothetical protein A2227_07225 [Candidatus Falkowbacteria bacterium RIFOXYA2_FULL_47_19]